MSDLLDVPRLAVDVLRRYTLDRVEQKLPVTFYVDSHRWRAEPADYKAPDRWLVRAPSAESYLTKGAVLDYVREADAFEVLE